jgi:hypothetical protein
MSEIGYISLIGKKTKNPSEKVSEGSQKSSDKQAFGAIRSFKAAETIPKENGNRSAEEHTNLSIKRHQQGIKMPGKV